jgi:hypothetical protein
MKTTIAIFAIALVVALPHGALAQTVTPPPVPDDIRVDPPNVPFLVGHAFGTQNYVCQPIDSVGRVDWVLFTPQATLFDDGSEQIITHFNSPNPNEDDVVRATWRDSRDTSTVWARATGFSSDPNFVSAGAIAWVRLAVEHIGEPGQNGGNTLSGTTFIQRLNTEGGLAPPTGCERPTDAGHRAFMPYTADYFFFTR